METIRAAFWATNLGEELRRLEASDQGLSGDEARERLGRVGPNSLGRSRGEGMAWLLLSQFKSPITLLLIAAAILSIFLRDMTDAAIILAIVAVSALLGFWQEKGAANAVRKLLALVSAKVTVLRGGTEVEIPADEVVPGDIVCLSAGSMVPADCRIVDARDLFANEAALTGETFPVEKSPGVAATDAPLNRRTNCLFSGTHVVSGTARALVVHTGVRTEIGVISSRLRKRPPETEFERGVRRFGYLLLEATMLLILGIFAINVLLHRPVLESFMFSLALAVGLTPQLLPAIISVNLSHGARRMADRGVIVRRLSSIENFGSIDVLCSDKTGTLTEGIVRLQACIDATGSDSPRALELACVNASFESGFVNPIDEALRGQDGVDIAPYTKLDEIPYDFSRKRLSVLVRHGERRLLITKGALDQILAVCESAELADARIVPLQGCGEAIRERYRELSDQGMRILGVAYRDVGDAERVGRQDESSMTLAGLLVLHDPVKQDMSGTVVRLKDLGVALKVITGDNRLVAAHVAAQAGLRPESLLTGNDLRQLSDEALTLQASLADVFAEIEPNQKERIILSLQKAGHVVGYMGDGINDATALHAADVGISVDQAVDVAKEAADLVLLKHDLAVLQEGIREGRATFANTLKYVFMATSANFGNMFSMAGASLFLPFLPLLPKQVLLLNLLTDIPEMTIATDTVDAELVARPRRWDVRSIRNFMLVFGTLSSVFDFLTFGVLLLLGADKIAFRTGWFVESVVSATLVVLAIRTRRPFLRSRPSRPLQMSSLGVVIVCIALPYLPFAPLLGMRQVPLLFLLTIAAIVTCYVCSAEVAKQWFYRNGNQ